MADYKEIKSIIVEIHFTYIHHFFRSIAGILNQDNDKCLNLKACKSTNRFSKSALASVPVHSGLTLATRVLVIADQLNFFWYEFKPHCKRRVILFLLLFLNTAYNYLWSFHGFLKPQF